MRKGGAGAHTADRAAQQVDLGHQQIRTPVAQVDLAWSKVPPGTRLRR